MDIRLTVHVPRRRPRPVEVVVTARSGARVEDLRRVLGEHLGMSVHALDVAGRALPDDMPVGMPPLLDGASVVVGARPEDGAPNAAGGRPGTVLEVVCRSGPDAGRSLPLGPDGVEVGRSPRSGLRLDDPSLSRRHVRLVVDADGVTAQDLGATNGVLVDGRRITGSSRVDTSAVVSIGASTLVLRPGAGPGLPVDHPGDGTVRIRPGPAPPTRLPAARVEVPRRPPAPAPGRIPWLAALVPVPVFVVMAFLLGPHLLAFALVGPVVVLATGLGDRVGGRRRHRAALEQWGREVDEADRTFANAVAAECRARHARHPDPHSVLTTAEHHGPGLWATTDDLTVRLGLGDLPSRAVRTAESGETPGVAASVPVAVDLREHPVLGVVGPLGRGCAVAAGVLGQLVVRHPPGRLRVLQRPDTGLGRWQVRLPHSGEAPLSVAVEVGTDPPSGADVRVLVVPERTDLPDGCSAVLELLDGASATLRAADGTRTLVADGVGDAWTDRLSRALAPLRLDGPGGTALPGSVALAAVLDGGPALTPDAVADRWRRSTGPTCTVGAGTDGAYRIDLARDGPHLLVGGTTGSGKSEFLRTLVTGLSLDSPPEALTLLLVDFKGGAAFGPCVRLPHVVGLVTDLDGRLVERVLRSLDAELRRRERALATSGAADLDDHRLRGGTPIPRLVVVVDELRALVDEQPEAVRGLVRLAAQGRSLGIHLVLATQRPSGTVTPEVQANVNLRIAFRVRDRADSVGVIGSDEAATLPGRAPGRGLACGGDGVLHEFQSALVAPLVEPPPVEVRTECAPDHPTDVDRGAETAAVVEVVRAAGDRTAHRVHRPWLPPLPDVLPAPGDSATVALVDEPDLQRQDAWEWGPAVPLWRLVGRPRSGRSGAVAALVTAASTVLGPDDLHVHVVAPDRPDWAGLPHVGAVVDPRDRPAVRALLDHLEALVAGPSDVTTLLVVDGWERLAESDDPRDATPLTEALFRTLRDGAGHGLRAAVTGGRDLLRPRWGALGGELLLLGEPDPVDAAITGLPSGLLPPDPPPGRGIRARDGREVQVVTPARPGPGAPPARLRPPWTYRPLPRRAPRPAPRPADRPEPGSVPLGLAAPDGRLWAWTPERDGRRLLVVGPPGSGRSTALDVLARSAAAHRTVVLVRDTPRGEGPRGEDLPGDGVEVIGPQDADRLVDLRTRHPDLLLLVDDADRLDDAPLAPFAEEIADLVDRDAGAVVAATTPATLRGRFRGLDASIARHGLGLVLRPARGDGDLLGAGPLPADGPGGTTPPGRGLVVLAGATIEVQVLDDRGADSGPGTGVRPAAAPAGRPAGAAASAGRRPA
ncbi:FHA domain-containing protein [Phycicoccus sp. BSK3Z-2]|uniref:FHA domain-containing protein n=1 Tax=Phycicoccus avicenniae TaxID=2828860 RepID=A0A941D879_9MICO|nr:FtsK/SpoIIIE domain-containing protein [Phycicoccus avicenniae]MBR7743874.1 FHA domain-containing protein [Phycicoccus avicenniae]